MTAMPDRRTRTGGGEQPEGRERANLVVLAVALAVLLAIVALVWFVNTTR